MNCAESLLGMGDVTRDAFYGGRFHILQPRGHGFRSGLDALLLAAVPPADAAGRAADLGAGAGAVGFAAASRCIALSVTLVENDAAMAALARRSRDLAENAALAPRLCVTTADVLSGRAGREAAGLADGGFSFVLTNPPFHPQGGRISPDSLRNAARAIPRAGFLVAWIRSASALLENGGVLALVARPENLRDILEAAHNRLGGLCITPVQPFADRPAHRILIEARRASRAGVSLLPPLVLHEADGTATARAAAIAMGEACLKA